MRPAGLALLAWGVVFLPAWADALEVGGSLRDLVIAGDNGAGQAVATDLARLRLEVKAASGPWAAQIAYDQQLIYGGLVTSPEFAIAAATPEPTYIDTNALISSRGRHQWLHRLYRGWLGFDTGRLAVSMGRQRIAWGSGRLWNPTDRFNPIDPTAVEPDEKTGVDSVMGEYRYSGFGAVQLVAAPGRAGRHVSRKLAARWRDTFGETDLSMLVGRFGDQIALGVDATTNLWDGGLRGELMHARSRGAAYTQLAAGYDYTLTNEVFPEGLYLLAEYFFNDAAGPIDATITDRLQTQSRHLFGFSAGYDLTPLWRLDGLLILDADQGGRFFAPQITWSARANVDVIAFAQLSAGNAGSDFAARANTYILQLDVYF